MTTNSGVIYCTSADLWHPFVSPAAPRHISLSYRVCMAAHPPVWRLAPTEVIGQAGDHMTLDPTQANGSSSSSLREARGMLTQHTWSPTPHWKRPSISITCKTHKKKRPQRQKDSPLQIWLEEVCRLEVCSFNSLLIFPFIRTHSCK